ncbi:MAG: polyprenyl synthetase family protein [Planctomycetes bacterium]|nr:polyprenyl synthetase family protein [Planctomycetota bacterium]
MTKAGGRNAKYDFERLVERFNPLADQALKRFAWANTTAPKKLVDSMNYSLWAGGKRLRPMLVLAGCEAVGGKLKDAMPAAAAFEMIHTYSLIHDDLPAMDDDDLRRGKPTNHKAFDEGTAILAGDAMLTYAFEVLSTHVKDATRANALVRELSRGAGMEGMAGGQLLDLEAEGARPNIDTLRGIHQRKTGALITSAVVCGGICGGAKAATLKKLRAFGEKIGLAFQVIDDILDMTATAAELGKSPGKDKAANKMTYPAVMGLIGAKKHAEELVAAAVKQVAGLKAPAALQTIAGYFIARTH